MAGFLSLARAAVCCSCFLFFTGASTGQAPEQLIPARFQQLNDALGFRWDFAPNGAINDGTNDCFDGGAILRINQSQLGFGRPMMTADGSEYVLSTKTPQLVVTRRIRLDRTAGFARYLEIVSNSGKEQQTVQITIHSDLGGNSAQVITDAEKPFAGQLEKGEGALVAMQSDSRAGVVFFVADPKGKQKPTVRVESGRSFDFTYEFKLKPGESAAVVHYIAQRNAASVADARALQKILYKRGRLSDATIPKDLTASLVNFSTTKPAAAEEEAESGPTLVELQTLLEAAEITRGATDVVMIDPSAKLTGTVTGGEFQVTTAFGKTEVPFADVAAITGGAGVQRPVRIFLRTGEIFTGTVEGAPLSMTTETGLKLPVDLAQIHLVAFRTSPADGAPPPDSAAFLNTQRGDRLAITAGATAPLQAATPWGMLEVQISELEALIYVRDPFPAHRLLLTDQSQLLVMLRGTEWRLPTARFGEVKLVPQSIRELHRAGSKVRLSADEEAPQITGPSCDLLGNSRIAGVVDLPRLHLNTGAGSTPFDPAKMAELLREPGADGAEATITVKLAEGHELTGRLAETVLPVRSGARIWRVPVAHLVSIKVPELEAAEADPAEGETPPSEATSPAPAAEQ
jgi:hypothetical protein